MSINILIFGSQNIKNRTKEDVNEVYFVCLCE